MLMNIYGDVILISRARARGAWTPEMLGLSWSLNLCLVCFVKSSNPACDSMKMGCGFCEALEKTAHAGLHLRLHCEFDAGPDLSWKLDAVIARGREQGREANDAVPRTSVVLLAGKEEAYETESKEGLMEAWQDID